MERKLTVELGERSYEVLIGPGKLAGLGEFACAIDGVEFAVVITDSTVAGLYGNHAVDSLTQAGLRVALIEFPAGEENKTLGSYADVMDALLTLDPPIDRNTLIVALGGGVAGDLAGFVAATALRGLRWLQCPTTLLADVDASVGGKTAVDHRAGKNLIGAFHQPRGVLVDVTTLKTLNAEGLADGLAESVKHAVIRDRQLLEFLEDNVDAILACDADVLTDLIGRNVAIKAAVVSADETEAGERAHLNLGHTIGHAIEIADGYGEVSHGQAVALGMVAACHLAAARGLIELDLCRRIEDILRRLGLPTRRAGMDAGQLWQIMQHDKKARSGQVRMILPVELGAVAAFDDVTPEQLAAALAKLTD